MKFRNPISEIRMWLWLWLPAVWLAAVPVCAATNSGPPADNLELSPPHAEIAPSFLERFGPGLAVFGVLLLALAAFAVWWWRRPRTSLPVPIEIQARHELQSLSERVQDGRTLSLVSRSLRRYFAAAFELPPGELTTTEFCRAAGASEKVGPELAAIVVAFLKHCDELKFAPSEVPPVAGVAARGLELVEQGEARRARLRAVP